MKHENVKKMVALALLAFAVSYIVFMRQEVRA